MERSHRSSNSSRIQLPEQQNQDLTEEGLCLGKGFPESLLLTFGVHNTILGGGGKSIHYGSRTKGCLNQSECSQVQPHSSAPVRGF